MPPEHGEPDGRSSLEMPSFSLRRRRKAAAEAPVAETPAPPVETLPAVAAAEAPAAVEAVEPPARRGLPAKSGLPAMSGLAAALVTGVAVGGLAVALTWLAGVGCEAVRGTSSCGGAIGLPTLVVVLALMAWTGSTLLRALGVGDAGSTSLLAVGVLAVIVMVFLLDSLDAWWTAIAVPVLAALSYAGAWALTSSVSDEGVNH